MKFNVGDRVTVRLWDMSLSGTVDKVVEFTDNHGNFRARRVVLLDEPIEGGKRWNVALDDISERTNDVP